MTVTVDRVRAARIFREEAIRRGFARVGIARAGQPARFEGFSSWVAAGRHAGMGYLERTAAVRQDPGRLLPGARSVVCLAAPHRSEPLRAADGSRVARYAAGPDYHGTLRARAEETARAAAARIGDGLAWRVCVDSTPLAERSFAAAAGIGWIGKNGCLIDRELGSWLLLAEILTDADLPPDDPVADACGSCVRCLTSCPTGAFVAPGILDARRCIAYWTIEHRGTIPDAVKPSIGEHVFGCDVCQEVCPWNPPSRRSRPSRTGADLPSLRGGGLGCEDDASPPTRSEWLSMGPGEWRRRFGATALNRAGRRGLQRNAAISAGAASDASARPALSRAASSGDRGLSDAARWADSRLGSTIERTT
jgi:epoxyqueuosine reductase